MQNSKMQFEEILKQAAERCRLEQFCSTKGGVLFRAGQTMSSDEAERKIIKKKLIAVIHAKDL